jgi:hypothetical protein
MTDNEYEERYCAYIDILGFRGLVDRIKTNKDLFTEIRNIIATVHRPLNNFKAMPIECDFKAQSISDAVAMSSRCSSSPVGLLYLLTGIENVGIQLLAQGYFVRGAVVRGLLHHSENSVFGEALVRAYDFESRIAKYPRVIVERNVALEIHALNESGSMRGQFDNTLLRSDDGPYFVNTLRLLSKEAAIKETAPDGTFHRVARRCNERLQLRLDESIDSPSHFEKARWFAEHWNRVMPSASYKVTGPGLGGFFFKD